MQAVPRSARPARRDVLRAGAGLATALAAGTAATGCAAGRDDGVAADGTVTIEMWHGQTDTGKKALGPWSPPSRAAIPTSTSGSAAASWPTRCSRR